MKRIILTVIVFAMLITSAGCSVGNNRTEAITTPEIEETYKIDEYMSDDKDNSNYHKNLMAYDGINGLCFDITLTEFVSRYNDTFWGIEDMELDGIETSSYQEGSALRNAILINRDIELVGINYDGDIEYYEENPLHRIYIPEFRFTVDGEERLNTVLLQMPTDLSGGYPADVLEQLLTREQAQDILRYGYGGMVLMACGISAALESPDTQSLTETLCDKFSTIKQMIDQVYMDMEKSVDYYEDGIWYSVSKNSDNMLFSMTAITEKAYNDFWNGGREKPHNMLDDMSEEELKNSALEVVGMDVLWEDERGTHSAVDLVQSMFDNPSITAHRKKGNDHVVVLEISGPYRTSPRLERFENSGKIELDVCVRAKFWNCSDDVVDILGNYLAEVANYSLEIDNIDSESNNSKEGFDPETYAPAPPLLSWEHYELTTSSDAVTIEGIVTNYYETDAQVTAKGILAAYDSSSGYWEVTVPLEESENEITVIAENSLGETAEETVVINR